MKTESLEIYLFSLLVIVMIWMKNLAVRILFLQINHTAYFKKDFIYLFIYF